MEIPKDKGGLISMRYELIELRIQQTQHILPVGDSLPHQRDAFCFCLPQCDVDCCGVLTWIHNSHDGREEFEKPPMPDLKLKVKRSH